MDHPSLRTRRIPYRTDLLVITVTGDIDLASAPDLATALRDETPPVLVVDLTKVTFLAAAGLRVLVEVATLAQEQDRCVGLVAEDSLAMRVLRTSGVAASIPTFVSLSDAVRELART